MASSGGSSYFHITAPRRQNLGAGDVARGLQVGQEIGKLIGGVAGAVKSSQQDAAANALMNAAPTAQANAQAAQDPDPDPNPDGTDNLAPTAATDPSGTQDPTPFTGGVAGMKLQQQFEDDQLSRQVKQAQLAETLARTSGTGGFAKKATPVTKQGVTMSGSGNSIWDGTNPPATGRSGSSSTKQPKYVAGTGDYENDATTDDAGQIKADFEAFHPGLYGKFQGATRDDQGNYVIPGKGKGTQTTDASGNVVTTPPEPEAVIPKEEGDIFQQRIQAAKRRAGIPYTDPDLKASGLGTADKPVIVDQSQPGANLRMRSLPPGTVVQDAKTGQRFTIKRTAANS